MARKKVDSRIHLTKIRREQLFDKCKGRCCHCGCELVLGDNFSIEHIIPLSKGGTNDYENTVALCKACNKEKGDDVVDVEFYSYAPKLIKEEIARVLEEYYEKCDWLTSKNVFKHDRYTINTTQHIHLANGKIYEKPAKCELRKMDEEEYEYLVGNTAKREITEEPVTDGKVESISDEGQPFKLIFNGKVVGALHCGLDAGKDKSTFRVILTIPENVNLGPSARCIFLDCIFEVLKRFQESVEAKGTKGLCFCCIDARADDKKSVKVIYDLAKVLRSQCEILTNAETNEVEYIQVSCVMSFGITVEHENGTVSTEDAIKLNKLYGSQLRRRVIQNQ